MQLHIMEFVVVANCDNLYMSNSHMKLAKKGKTKTLSLFARILKWLNRQKLSSITSWTYGLPTKN